MSGISGTVVSAANCVATGPETLRVRPITTRVRNSNVGGAVLDQISVPTGDLVMQATVGFGGASFTLT